MHGYILTAALLLAVGAEPPVDRVQTPEFVPHRRDEPMPPLRPFDRRRDAQPILKFEQLSFKNEELQRETKLFHDLAEERTQPGGEMRLYERARAAPKSRWSQYCAYWISKGGARPSRQLTIWLEGPRTDGVDRLSKLRVDSRIDVKNGWTAIVNYSDYRFEDGKPIRSVNVSVEPTSDARQESSGPGSHLKRLRLTSPEVSALADETPKVRYGFGVLQGPMSFDRALRSLWGTPEMLRDEALFELRALREEARGQLKSGTQVTLYDASNASGANPPTTEPAQGVSDDIMQALEKQVEQQIAAQETTVRENFREIHAAIQQALPLRELLEELDRQAKPDEKE